MSTGVDNHPSSSDYNAQVDSNFEPNMPEILATEVLEQFEARCGGGQQYCTFPNRISAAEKAKLENLGYVITENIIEAANLGKPDGDDMYIGFQIALNSTAAAYAMTISQEETNGIDLSGGGGGGTSYTEKQLLDSPLVGNISSITLNDDMNNYDQLVFTFGVTAENQDWSFTKTLLVSNFGDSKNFYLDGMVYNNNYWSVHYALRKYDDTTITVIEQGQRTWGEPRTIFGIKGIKFGSGSGGGSGATVDTAMSDSSTNAVQNKVIKGYVDGITGDINTVLEGVL